MGAAYQSAAADALVNVLTFLPCSDVCAAAAVCRKWHEAATADVMWEMFSHARVHAFVFKHLPLQHSMSPQTMQAAGLHDLSRVLYHLLPQDFFEIADGLFSPILDRKQQHSLGKGDAVYSPGRTWRRFCSTFQLRSAALLNQTSRARMTVQRRVLDRMKAYDDHHHRHPQQYLLCMTALYHECCHPIFSAHPVLALSDLPKLSTRTDLVTRPRAVSAYECKGQVLPLPVSMLDVLQQYMAFYDKTRLVGHSTLSLNHGFRITVPAPHAHVKGPAMCILAADGSPFVDRAAESSVIACSHGKFLGAIECASKAYKTPALTVSKTLHDACLRGFERVLSFVLRLTYLAVCCVHHVLPLYRSWSTFWHSTPSFLYTGGT